MNKYNPLRTKNLYNIEQKKPFKLSRSKIESFLKCPRCFYFDRKCGTDRPPSMPFTLNSAVDKLLKKEFDKYRTENKPHPLLVEHRIDAIPFSHPQLEDWRTNLKGIQYLHESTNLLITGAIDDLWINSKQELIIVDYKATSTKQEITLETEYQRSYKRQIEIYQWLLRKNRFKVSNTSYFVYCNADTEKNDFQKKLDFEISLIPYEGDDTWIEKTLASIKNCLESDSIPKSSENCDYCRYLAAITTHIK